MHTYVTDQHARALYHVVIRFFLRDEARRNEPPSPLRATRRTFSVRVTRSAVTHLRWIDKRIVRRREIINKNYNSVNDA